MYVRIDRVVAAGDRLRFFVETSGGGCEKSGALVQSWNAAVRDLRDEVSQSREDEELARVDARDFDYLAFDSATREPIGFGTKAVFALQNADEAAPESEITVLYAGSLGRTIWDQRISLDLARPLIGVRLPACGRQP